MISLTVKPTGIHDQHAVSDFRRVYFRGSEIECQRFIIKTTLKIKHIAMIYYPDTVTYQAHTNYGIVDIQQVVDADSLYDSMFYDPTYCNNTSLNFKEVLIEALAWDKSMNEYFEGEQNKEQDASGPDFTIDDIHPTQFPQ